MRNLLKKFLILLLTLAVCLSVSACDFINDSRTELTDSIIASQNIKFNTIEQANRQEYKLVDAVEKVEKTSVAINITNSSSSGSGSGVIVDVKNSGNFLYVITCHHVISLGGDITISLPDENALYDNEDYIFTGKIGEQIYSNVAVTLVGGDNVSDIAVIKINLDMPAVSGKKLSIDKVQKAIIPAEGYEIRRGEAIFAIGNPSGELPGSVADGIVSYPNRKVIVGEVGEMQLMQISVTTNPGNSGGGLYNLYGELIGITNAGNTNYDAINFAIPVELENGNGFVSIASQLIATATSNNYGYVSGRWNLGIMVGQVSDSHGEKYVNINQVFEKGNCYLAGVKAGDIVTSLTFCGETYDITVDNFHGYVALMRTKLKQGDSFTISVDRKVTNSVYNNLDIVVNISVADFIFCDTGM